MLKGCKFQIYPTKEQEEILFIYCKHSHNMRNFLVSKYQNNLPKTNRYGIVGYKEGDLLNEYLEKYSIEFNLPIYMIKGIIMNYKYSVDKVYKKIGKQPKFHKYESKKQSFYIASKTYQINNKGINLPHAKGKSVVGMSKITVDLDYVKKFNIKEIIEPRYHYAKGKWYISGSYKVEEPIKQNLSAVVGLDWGIKNFFTSSNNEFINYPKSIEREFYRINRLKSLRDKKVKNSNNYNKLNSKVILAYERFENLKKDFIEQTTTRLCRHSNIAIENLTNAKIIESNKNRRRRKQIYPRSRFVESLKWKCKKFGTDLYEVNPAYTSQTCSCCGNRIKLTLKDRIFKCSCGLEIDRDINAAINIAAMAIRSS